MDLLLVFTLSKSGRLCSRSIVAALNQQEDRPWMQLRKGKEIDQLWLARQLAPYGIRPRTIRTETATAKGYMQDDFWEAFRRYIPRSELDKRKAESAEGAPN
jgi:hypothetical protein